MRQRAQPAAAPTRRSGHARHAAASAASARVRAVDRVGALAALVRLALERPDDLAVLDVEQLLELPHAAAAAAARASPSSISFLAARREGSRGLAFACHLRARVRGRA